MLFNWIIVIEKNNYFEVVMSISGMPDKSNLPPNLPSQPKPKRLKIGETERKVELQKTDTSLDKLENKIPMPPTRPALVDRDFDARELKIDTKTYNYQDYENVEEVSIPNSNIEEHSSAPLDFQEFDALDEKFQELEDYIRGTEDPINLMLEKEIEVNKELENMELGSKNVPVEAEASLDELIPSNTATPIERTHRSSLSEERHILLDNEENSRGINYHFYGELAQDQVIKELKGSMPGEAIYYLSGKMPKISYMEDGRLKHIFLKKDKPIEEQLEGKLLKIPNFTTSIYDNQKLDINEAIVREKNGYQFVTTRTSGGIENSNDIFGSDYEKGIKLYTKIEDLKEKPYYFGEISSYEAKKILSQQSGPSMLVRKKGDEYLLNMRGINKSNGEPTYIQLHLSLKKDSLIESNILLEVEKKLGQNGSIVKPKGMNLISNKVHSYAKMLKQGIRTHTATIAKRLFPSSPVSSKIQETPRKNVTFAPSNVEMAKELVRTIGLSDMDWGMMNQSDVEKILNENLPLGSSILWRDPDYAGFKVSKKGEEGIIHQQFGSIEEYSEKGGSPGNILYPESEKSLKLLNHFNLREKNWGIIQRNKGKALADTYLKRENDAIVWQEHRFPGIIISHRTKEGIVHDRILPEESRKNFDYTFISPISDSVHQAIDEIEAEELFSESDFKDEITNAIQIFANLPEFIQETLKRNPERKDLIIQNLNSLIAEGKLTESESFIVEDELDKLKS